MPYVAQRWGARPPQVALLGISMGGQGALRMAYKYPDVFPTVAAISPAIDFQKRIEEGVDPGLAQMYRDAEDARQDSALLHIHPLNWPRNQFFCCDPADLRWHDSADRLRMKLWSLGVPFECDLETSAGGHSRQYFSHLAERAVGFLAERLERERLRVV
jgi:S-formylglutathione hydrolase FrmB